MRCLIQCMYIEGWWLMSLVQGTVFWNSSVEYLRGWLYQVFFADFPFEGSEGLTLNPQEIPLSPQHWRIVLTSNFLYRFDFFKSFFKCSFFSMLDPHRIWLTSDNCLRLVSDIHSNGQPCFHNIQIDCTWWYTQANPNQGEKKVPKIVCWCWFYFGL